MFGKKKTKELSFFHSLIIIVLVFASSISIIYYSSIKGEAYDNPRVVKSSYLKSSVILNSPRSSDLVGSNFVLSGKAKVNSNLIYYRVLNSKGEILYQGKKVVYISDQYFPFLLNVVVDPEKITTTGAVEFFIIDSQGGEEQIINNYPLIFYK